MAQRKNEQPREEDSAAAPRGSATLSEPAALGRDHIRGPADAGVTLLEYGDYECPFSATAAGVVNAIEARMGNQIRFVFRHFPLTSVHPHAQLAAEAAEAAGAQRQFWAMHELLYQQQRDLSEDALLRCARMLDLNIPAFTAALTNHTFLSRVRRNFMSGVTSGVNGTPSFYINGFRHDGPWDLPVLLGALQRAAETACDVPNLTTRTDGRRY